MIILKNKFIFYLLIGICLFLGIVLPFVLSSKFYYDANMIVADVHNEKGFIGSYPISMLFYSVTRLGKLPYSLVALIQLPIIYYLIKKIGIPKDFYLLTIKNTIVFFSFFMLAIFIGQPSKEFFTFIFTIIILMILTRNYFTFNVSLVLVFLLLLFFGVLFRPYFVLIPIIAVGMYFVTFIRFERKNITTIFYGILIAVFLSLSYGIIKGKHFSESTREGLNLERLGAADANSMIVSPVSTNTWYGETIGIFYGFFTVNLPFNGLKHIFSPQIIAFIIWQLLLFWILLVQFSKCLKDKKKYKKELWVLLILFSYFIVQGVFEPDLGSAVRHKIGMFPLIYYALYYEDFRKALRKTV